jgi:predicted metal-binding protein
MGKAYTMNTNISEEQRGRLRPYLEKALAEGADHAVVVSASDVVTAPWVRMKCQFGCSNYGRMIGCPPNSPAPDQTRSLLDSFTTAILLHRHVVKGREPVDRLNDLAVDLERMLFFDGFYRAWAAGSGPCRKCKECNMPGPCRHSDRARPSMEACGIDVFATARAQGLPIRTLRDREEERDFYALVLAE